MKYIISILAFIQVATAGTLQYVEGKDVRGWQNFTFNNTITIWRQVDYEKSIACYFTTFGINQISCTKISAKTIKNLKQNPEAKNGQWKELPKHRPDVITVYRFEDLDTEVTCYWTADGFEALSCN